MMSRCCASISGVVEATGATVFTRPEPELTIEKSTFHLRSCLCSLIRLIVRSCRKPGQKCDVYDNVRNPCFSPFLRPAAAEEAPPPRPRPGEYRREADEVHGGQRASVRKQMPRATPRRILFRRAWTSPQVVSLPPVLAVANCPALPENELKPLVDKAAADNKLRRN